MHSETVIDAVIVGGGPAGLAAALVLGRCLRQVIIFDAGEPRNAGARVFNGYLSRDGTSPQEFLEIGRAELFRYETVQFRADKVEAIKRLEDRFEVISAAEERVISRVVLLATGLKDELPDIEGFKELYGKSVYSCPYCDGWECRGQPIAVYGNDEAAAELAMELLQWSKDLVLFTDGPLSCPESVINRLRMTGIQIEEKRIAKLERKGDELQGIRFVDGSVCKRTSLFLNPNQVQQTSLVNGIGCKVSSPEGFVVCGDDAATSIPGLYAAGNARHGVQLVISAVSQGTLAAMAINTALSEADINK